MSAYIRNFEIITTLGSYIVDVDLGTSSAPLSGVVDFVSLPGLTSFKIKNAAFERFNNILSCSALKVFDISDSRLSLSTIISCLSVFSDRKSIIPETTGTIVLTGAFMPALSDFPPEDTLGYELTRLYNYLTSDPYSWRVYLNLPPENRFVTINNQTLSLATTGTRSSYIIVDKNVTNFNFLVNGIDGIYVNAYYDAQALSSCFLTLTGTPQLTATPNILYANQKAVLSAIDGSLHTFYFFNTGSFLLGLSPNKFDLPSINKQPIVTPVGRTYLLPPRYGYVDGIQRSAFNTTTRNKQTSYVVVNTATKLFSIKINETTVLSAYNKFSLPLQTSFISFTGVANVQPSTKTLPFTSTIGVTASNFQVYDIRYFYENDGRIVLGITNQNQTIIKPTYQYDRYIILAPVEEGVPYVPPTQLPPAAAITPSTTPPNTQQPGPVTTPPVVTLTTQAPTTTPPPTTTAPPVTLTTTPPLVTITTTPPPTTTEPPITVTTPPPTTTTTPPPPTTTPPTAQNTYVEYELVDSDINLNPPGDDIEIVN